MKELISVALALVIALSLCLPVYAEGGVQKYGDIGRLSKLNITEDELNEVLKDIMVNSMSGEKSRRQYLRLPRP